MDEEGRKPEGVVLQRKTLPKDSQNVAEELGIEAIFRVWERSVSTAAFTR